MGDTEYFDASIAADQPGRRPLSPLDLLAVGMFLAAVLWASLGFATVPHDVVTVDRVDLAEVNHFFDDNGKLVFDQVVFYEWLPREGRHQVQAWRLLKTPGQRPERDYRVGDYAANWEDNGTFREVRAATVRESWTQYDPELVDRDRFPKEWRRDLGRR